MDGIKFPAALARLLGTNLAGAVQRSDEDIMQRRPTGDLAANVADDAAETRVQQPQVLAVAVEILGLVQRPAIRAACLATYR
jgi:hypothetical protein